MVMKEQNQRISGQIRQHGFQDPYVETEIRIVTTNQHQGVQKRELKGRAIHMNEARFPTICAWKFLIAYAKTIYSYR